MNGGEGAGRAVIVRAEPGSAIATGLLLELNERCFAARLLEPGESTPVTAPAVLWLLEPRAMLEHLQRACAASPLPNLVLAATRSLARDALEHIDDRDDVASARAVAERVRQTFASAVIDGVEGQRIAATLSAGVAELTATTGSGVALVQHASNALLQAKSAGRHRVELAA